MEDMTIEFDDATQCYKIPVTGTVGYYRAVVTKLFKRSGKLHVTVGYIPTASTDDSIINVSSDTPTKYMDYLFERQSGSWYLTGLMGVGRSIFYRKVRGVTGYSPNEYIRIMRMKKAAELLSSPENLTVAEVSYQVGINDPFYFSKCFKLQFGVTPSVYQKGGRGEKEKEANADSEVKEE